MLNEQYRSFFEAYFGPLPETDVNGEVCISNPFRGDSTPSLYVNLTTGKYNDFGSDFKGDAPALFIDMHDADFAGAMSAVEEWLSGIPPKVQPIPEMKIEEWHSQLLSNIPIRAYLTQNRGLSLEVIKEFQLGWDGTRYTIPIRNKYGVCVNVRRYDPKATTGKMISYGKGFGAAKLFPLSSLASEKIILHEGEWDTLLQISKGFPAITSTAGAGTWFTSWNPLFKDKIVYICFDADSPGQKGAIKIASLLRGIAKDVLIIKLPLAGTRDDKDISDFYINYGNERDEFEELLKKAVKYEPAEEDIEAKQIKSVSLVEARSSEYKHRRVEFDVQVIGKDTAPYNIPRKGIYKCSAIGSHERLCSQCGICLSGGELILDLPIHPNSLELIKASKSVQSTFLKSTANIPNSCKQFTFEETRSTNIEEILIAPEIPEFNAWNGRSNEYLVQTAYFANQPIETNRSYRMQGVMTPDPWQQHVTFVLDSAEPLQDTVESFKMTPENYEKLKVFQTQNVAEKFKEIHTDFEENVTHIVGRKDLLTGIDLVYHSVLGFNFQGITVQKGWLEFLCIGDTRTGKSETTEHMLRHYRLGEISVAENTSYAGLVGGLQQTGDKRWFLTWGKLPLNDGRIFVIDEASGLSIDDIAKMSGIRSSGIAEITKIQTERTTSRTRLIWLSNPRSGNPLQAYSHGIQAVAELIGKAEDISRFDFVVTAAKDEVPIEEINKVVDLSKAPEHKYTSDLCKLLVLWAWSRKPEDVIFEDTAVQKILDYATTMGKRYSSRIPLVEGASQRIKLARLAVATAARVFSTDSTGNSVIVKDMHVDFSYQYLEEIYSKPSLNYKGYSTGEYLDAFAAKKNKPHVLGLLTAHPAVPELCSRQDYIWVRTFEEQLKLDRMSAVELISALTSYRMLRDTGNRGYVKTPGFISILREWEQANSSEELEEVQKDENFSD